MKDIAGNELLSGDNIVYATVCGSSVRWTPAIFVHERQKWNGRGYESTGQVEVSVLRKVWSFDYKTKKGSHVEIWKSTILNSAKNIVKVNNETSHSGK